MQNKKLNPEKQEILALKSYFDRIVPGVIRFYADHYICGNFFKSVWAITEYPPTTEETALLAHLADRNGVTLRIYNRLVNSVEQRQIVQQAMRRNRMMTTATDVSESVKAQDNIQDVAALISELRRNKEPLLHTAVFIELKAPTLEKLHELQADISMELTRSKISVDRLLLRQKEGFLSVLPTGHNQFGTQLERVIPASAAANLYPLNYSGKTDAHGFYIGRDKFGSNVLVDFDKRAADKTNSNILILGNSGQGKSYLMKLLCNLRESGKSVICLDPEAEYQELCENLGGTYIDMMSGEYMINPLEPKSWGEAEKSEDAPETFPRVTRLSQHISYLKDFFRSYKAFTDAEIDTIELMLLKLYARFGIDDATDFSCLSPEHYPTVSDLYELTEKEYKAYDREKRNLYTEDTLQNICLGLHSMCKGAESQYFDGHTNIKDAAFICFGVKGLMDTNKRLKNMFCFPMDVFQLRDTMDRIHQQDGSTKVRGLFVGDGKVPLPELKGKEFAADIYELNLFTDRVEHFSGEECAAFRSLVIQNPDASFEKLLRLTFGLEGVGVDLKELDVSLEYSVPENVVCRLLIAPPMKESQAVWLELPCLREQLHEIEKDFGCPLKQMVCREMQSILPRLQTDLSSVIEHIGVLNVMAQQLQSIAHPEDVITLLTHLHEYDFDARVCDDSDYALAFLRANLPDEFDADKLRDTDMSELGEALRLDKLGTVTPYGVVSGRGQMLYTCISVGPEQEETEMCEERTEVISQ